MKALNFVEWIDTEAADVSFIGKVIEQSDNGAKMVTAYGEMFIPANDGQFLESTEAVFNQTMLTVKGEKQAAKFAEDVMALNDKPKAKKAVKKAKKATAKKTGKPSKISIAIGIYTKAIDEGKDRAYIIEQFIAVMGVSKGNAGTYIHDVKRKLAAA